MVTYHCEHALYSNKFEPFETLFDSASTHKDGKVFTAIEVPNVLAENEPMQQMLWPDHCVSEPNIILLHLVTYSPTKGTRNAGMRD